MHNKITMKLIKKEPGKETFDGGTPDFISVLFFAPPLNNNAPVF